MYFCFVYFEIIILSCKYTVKLFEFFFYHACVLKLFLWYWIFDLTTTSNYSVSKWYPIIAFLGPCCFQSVQKNGTGSRRRRVRKRHLGTSNGKRRVRKFFFLIFFLKAVYVKTIFRDRLELQIWDKKSREWISSRILWVRKRFYLTPYCCPTITHFDARCWFLLN